MTTNFTVEIGKIGLFIFIRSHGIPKCSIAILIHKIMFICDDLATLCVNLVNTGPVTIEFKIGKYVHPIVSFSKINLSDKISGSTGPTFTKF